MAPTFPGRIDWQTERERIDLAAVATLLLGPAPGRRGERGRRLWWPCPFHEDANPSFCIDPGKAWWRCFGCGEHGDAATLVMRLEGLAFPEAVARLTDGPGPSAGPGPRPRPSPRPEAPRPAAPSGMPVADALVLVAASERRLWAPEGADALDALRGRGLADATIRAARLGVAPPLDLPGRPRGVVIAWFDGDRLALVKLRQPEGSRPKYREVFRDPARLTVYPGPGAIRAGRPLVIVEGEFDALLLGQELGDLAGVLTLGGASARPTLQILGPMLFATPWFIATDADPAGDKAAGDWPPNTRRVRPPGSFKDWCEAKAGGIDLARWWSDILAGIEGPQLFTWQELAAWHWGPAANDPTPGIIVPGSWLSS